MPRSLGCLQNGEQFMRADLRDRPLSKRRRELRQEPPGFDDRDGGATFQLQLGDILPGNRTESVCSRNPGRHARFTLRKRRVGASVDRSARRIPLGAGLFQRDIRVGAERELFLLARQPILEAPELRTAGRHQQIQPLPIGKLPVGVASLGHPDARVGQSHREPLPNVLQTAARKAPRLSRMLANASNRKRSIEALTYLILGEFAIIPARSRTG
jgi:hypothetical protein